MTALAPPSALEAEQAVLSACLLSADAVDDVADLLKPEHFYSDQHRLVWGAVVDVTRAGHAADVVTVADALRHNGTFAAMGGARYLAELVDATPAVSNVRDHAALVRDRWQLRRLIAECQRLAAEGYQADDAQTHLDRAEQAVFAIGDTRTDGEPVMLGNALATARQHLGELARGDRKLLGVSTGLRALDGRTSGLQRGDLTILAARPGMGKTACAIGMALTAARAGTVALFSLEMPTEQVSHRVLAMAANVDLARMRHADLSEASWRALDDAGNRASSLPVAIDDTSGINLFQMRRTLRRLKRNAQRSGSDLALVVVDYLQLMQPVDLVRGRSREQEVSEISRGLKAIAKQLSVPVLALSQLSRKVEDRSGRRPQLSDLRESGAIEQDADNVLFLYRPGYYSEQEGKPDQTEGETEVIVAKQRNGPTGVVKVQWWSGSASFTDVDSRDWEAP